MAAKLKLHVDPAIAEITDLSSGWQKRWYLTKTPLKEGFEQVLTHYDSIESVEFSSTYVQHLLEKRAGDPPALLTTAGFESWPFVRQPLKSNLDVRPSRAPSLLSPDLVFGISERVSNHGEIQTQPKAEEVDFLISKLQFTGVKNVAVGFLNSHLNSGNEEFVAQKLKDAGLNVSCSHQFHLPIADRERPNEVARWWRTFSDAYVRTACQELFAPFVSFCSEKGITINWGAFSPEKSWVDMLTSAPAHARKAGTSVLYAGFDSFSIVTGEVAGRVVETGHGPLLLSSPVIEPLFVQPLTEIGSDEFGGVSLLDSQVMLDPGPMVFGRSLKPTLVDLLAGTSEHSLGTFRDIEGLPKSNLDKINYTFSSLARTQKLSHDELVSNLIQNFFKRLDHFLSRNKIKRIHVTGSATEILRNAFSHHKVKMTVSGIGED